MGRGREAPALGELDDSSVWDMWSPRLGLSGPTDALMLDVNEQARLGRQPAILLRTSSAASGSAPSQLSRPATSQSRISSRMSSRPSTSGSVSPRQATQAMMTTGIPSHKASSPKPLAGHSFAFTTIHDPMNQRKHAWGVEFSLPATLAPGLGQLV